MYMNDSNQPIQPEESNETAQEAQQQVVPPQVPQQISNSVDSFLQNVVYPNVQIATTIQTEPVFQPLHLQQAFTQRGSFLQNLNIFANTATPTINQTIQPSILEQSFYDDTSVKLVASDDGIKKCVVRELYDSDVHKNDMCPITFEQFTSETTTGVLPCKHVFNYDSLIEWLTRENNRCPVCRYEVPSKELSLVTESDTENATELSVPENSQVDSNIEIDENDSELDDDEDIFTPHFQPLQNLVYDFVVQHLFAQEQNYLQEALYASLMDQENQNQNTIENNYSENDEFEDDNEYNEQNEDN
mgnify:CR=1 FL=1